MKIVFKKSDLPLLDRFLHYDATPRDHWRLAVKLRDQDGFVDHAASRQLMLERGAYGGDPWCMCELARYYWMTQPATALPQALSWWHKAAQRHDAGAVSDLQRLPIAASIRSYNTGKGSYADIEMRCTLLAEWHLTRMGTDDWNTLPYSQQLKRVEALVKELIDTLHLPPVSVYVRDPLLMQNGQVADGMAHPGPTRMVGLNKPIFANYGRLLQVLLHELGHHVVFTILYDGDRTQRTRYGITEQRVRGWKAGAQGLAVPTTEEDPDTLAYGVYTTWLALFGEPL